MLTLALMLTLTLVLITTDPVSMIASMPYPSKRLFSSPQKNNKENEAAFDKATKLALDKAGLNPNAIPIPNPNSNPNHSPNPNS